MSNQSNEPVVLKEAPNTLDGMFSYLNLQASLAGYRGVLGCDELAYINDAGGCASSCCESSAVVETDCFSGCCVVPGQ